MRLSKVEGLLKNNERDILYDITYCKEFTSRLIPVIFIHGFKGYKDWGAFNLVANEFAKHGFLFLKFNFSHNGTNKDNSTEFVDLEAFGNNNFSLELSDLDAIINLVEKEYSGLADFGNLTLMAHSRGGATAIIKTAEDLRIKRLVTWASVGTIKDRLPRLNKTEFERTNVLYLPNARTNQQMPIYYQFVEDYYKNENRFNLLCRARAIEIPVLLIHGAMDETVGLNEANELKEAIYNVELEIIENGDHSFGAAEPWLKESLPKALKEVVAKSIDFMKNGLPSKT